MILECFIVKAHGPDALKMKVNYATRPYPMCHKEGILQVWNLDFKSCIGMWIRMAKKRKRNWIRDRAGDLPPKWYGTVEHAILNFQEIVLHLGIIISIALATCRWRQLPPKGQATANMP